MSDEPDARLAMRFEKSASRYYQQHRVKHSSGSAEWHCRTERQRRIQRAVAASGTVGELAARLRRAMEEEEE